MRNNPFDRYAFRSTLIERDYDTKGWAQDHARLQQRYGQILSGGRVPIIVDASANIGTAAIWFAEQYPKAIVYAVEPEDGNFSILLRNAAGRPIVPLAGAVWDRPAQLRIANPGGAPDAFRVIEGSGSLRSYLIPDIVTFETHGELFIVKVDIEGGNTPCFEAIPIGQKMPHLSSWSRMIGSIPARARAARSAKSLPISQSIS